MAHAVRKSIVIYVGSYGQGNGKSTQIDPKFLLW